MNGAQIAHYLKVAGKGREAAGLEAIYRTGMHVGAQQILAGGVAVYAAYRIGKWGYEKLMDYLQQNRYIEAAGEVV